MAPKAAQEKQKKKAAKQKKILMILVLPMIGALVYAYTTMSGLGGKTVVAAKSASSTTSAVVTPTAGATAPTADTAAAPITPGIAGVPIVALHSFTALGQKDPFNDHGPKPGAGSGSSSGSSSSSSAKGNGKGSSSSGGGSQSKQPSAPLTGAVISLNGDKLALALGAAFGHAPGLSGVALFRLVKVTPKTALIGVVGTHQQFTLHVKHPLTLQQNGGWTYTLILEPLGTAAPMTVQTTSTTSTSIHDQQGP